MDAKIVCSLLNRLLEEQPDFTNAICKERRILSEGFGNSSLPFVCSKNELGDFNMGVIGIINGIISDGVIAACYEDDNLVNFKVIK